MIGKYLDRKSGLGEVVSVMGESIDNGIKFLIRPVPSLLTVLEFVVEEEDGAPLALIILLFNHSCIGDIGGVGRETNLFFGIEGGEEDVVSNGSKEGFEGFLFFSVGGPGPRGILFEKVIKTRDSVRVVGDEFVIKTDHPEEGTEVGDASWGFDIPKCLDLVMGHPDALATDDIEAKEVNFLSIPFTFVGLKPELVLGEGIKDLGNMVLVFFHISSGKHDDVI